MLRLRLLRILLPGLLVVLGVIVAYNLKSPERVHTEKIGPPAAAHAEVLTIEEYVRDLLTVAGTVDRVEDAADGSLQLEGIHDLRISRPDRRPIVVSADRGAGIGPEGERRWQFEKQVVFFDPDSQLRLVLPVLQLDQPAGEARSSGDIQFSAPGVSGTVAGVVYGLRGQPGVLTGPVLRDDAGGRLVADSATLWDGFQDLELTGHVRAEQPSGWIEAERMRATRDEQQRLRSVAGRGAVLGHGSLAPMAVGDLSGDELDVSWDEAGRLERVRLHGNALVRRGRDSLAAPTIEAVRREADGGWDVDAHETVTAQGLFSGGAGSLRAETLEAELDAAARLTRATARGRVVFEGPAMRAEGERGHYEAAPAGGEVQLYGEGRHKAHIAQGLTRVAAQTISTDVNGRDLKAAGAVEATLLPRSAGTEEAGRGGVFLAGEAVHFVAEELHSEEAGERLEFRGAVRGWQGERNLAASRVVLTQRPSVLAAEGEVSSRFPRAPSAGAIGEADFVLISADRLDYDEGRSEAIYEGNVKMRFAAEGRLAANRLEVQLDPAKHGIVEARAIGGVSLEVHESADGEMAEPVAGHADRLIYVPTEATLRLIGESAPAELRRLGPGATTSGRVLLYRLDRGTYELDSGSQGPATIRTTSGEKGEAEPQ